MPRVVFTFDDVSLTTLRQLTHLVGANSMAETLRKSLRLMSLLADEQAKGKTELVARDPVTGSETAIDFRTGNVSEMNRAS